MKYFVVVILSALAVSASAIPVDTSIRINGENGWYVPQADGSFKWMAVGEIDQDDIEREVLIEGRSSTNPVTFNLYTRDNPEEAQVITTSNKSIDASNYNPANPTRISIHGWEFIKNYEIKIGVRDAWLGKGEYNFIFVEWERASSLNYITSSAAVAGVGEKVASLVDFLVENYSLDLSTLHIIGHSLGAHVAGFTGKNIKSGKPHTIIGLDPALPLFSYDEPSQRLSSDDAAYVESIQTNGGNLGFLKPIGKGAFYPNGGEKQDGCFWDLMGTCSHNLAVTYYAEAVTKDNFDSIKCGDYKEAVAKNCSSSYNSVRMGAVTDADRVAGEFYVPVNSETPYGKRF